MTSVVRIHGVDTGRRQNTIVTIIGDLRPSLMSLVVDTWTGIKRNVDEDMWDLTTREDFSD